MGRGESTRSGTNPEILKGGRGHRPKNGPEILKRGVTSQTNFTCKSKNVKKHSKKKGEHHPLMPLP